MWRGKLEAVAVCRAGGGEANNRVSRAKGVTRPSMTHCPPRQKNAKGVIAAATPSSAMDDQDAAAAVMAAITTSVPDNATAVVVPKPVSEILRSSQTKDERRLGEE